MTDVQEPLDEGTVDPDPLVQFGRWYERAATVTASPEAMAVATADSEGRPSVRMVLLKSWGDHGFTFFTTRPHASQVGAHASRQSRVIGDRAALDGRVEELETEYAGQPVPRPPWWGGVRITPVSFEFWQQRDNRLHDRLRFTPAGDRWSITRLQP